MQKRKKMARAGRKKEFDTPGWKTLTLTLPDELWRSLRRYCFEKEERQATFVRELVEKHLESKGVLKVITKKDAEGRQIKTYQIIE